MRQIIYDKVKHIADKYKGYIDTEDLMKEFPGKGLLI